MAKIPNNSRTIKDLQDDIATMRKDAPKYYSEMLKKEFAAVHNNFAQADFKGFGGEKVCIKPINSSYINDNLQEEVTPNEKLILLNAKSDALLKCIEYLKK